MGLVRGGGGVGTTTHNLGGSLSTHMCYPTHPHPPPPLSPARLCCGPITFVMKVIGGGLTGGRPITMAPTIPTAPASTRREVIPAEFQTRLKEVPVCGPRWEWRRTTECEVPAAAPGLDYVPQAAPYEQPMGNPDIPPAGGLPPLR